MLHTLIEAFGDFANILASWPTFWTSRRRNSGLIMDIPQLPIPPVRSQLVR